MSIFFPVTDLVPAFDEEVLDCGEVRVVRRKWEVSTFDLATLATRHNLHFPYQLMDVFLPSCNCEIELKFHEVFEDAAADVEILKAMLYLCGVTPFIMPFGLSGSINEYAGINSRDSESLRKKMHPGLQDGPTSEEMTIEGWLHQPSFHCIARAPLKLTEEVVRKAVDYFTEWRNIEVKYPDVRAARMSVAEAPALPDLASSLLYLWQGIEALFDVKTEVRFRISFLLAQLSAPIGRPLDMYELVKKAYNDRSDAAHGRVEKITVDAWLRSWTTINACLLAVIKRQGLPTEQELIAELLGAGESPSE